LKLKNVIESNGKNFDGFMIRLQAQPQRIQLAFVYFLRGMDTKEIVTRLNTQESFEKPVTVDEIRGGLHRYRFASELPTTAGMSAIELRAALNPSPQNNISGGTTSAKRDRQLPTVGDGASSVSTSSNASWPEQRISHSLRKLAKERGITNANEIAVMIDWLLRPNMSVAAQSTDGLTSKGTLSSAKTRLREKLGLTVYGERAELAKLIGMPLSKLVARIGTAQDPTLGKRVIENIPQSRREMVAEKLLTLPAGSDTEFGVYYVLNKMFTEDPQFTGQYTKSVVWLRETFAPREIAKGSIERYPALKAMGFSSIQILGMNPASKLLLERLDPALGTYSEKERKERTALGLPNTKEEAALRILTGRSSKNEGLAYRQYVALAIVSHRPLITPREINNSYLEIRPNSNDTAGGHDLGRLFRVAENKRGIQIPRSAQLQDRDYILDVNTELLRSFGIGKVSARTGKLESIPTSFERRDKGQVSDRPDEKTKVKTPAKTDLEPCTWQQVLPLVPSLR
jgi:hypothetical protein